MSNPHFPDSEQLPKQQPEPKSSPPSAVAVHADTESQQAPATGGFGVTSVLRRWKREDMIRKGSVGLRAIALVFSVISFIVMASNKHGDWQDFDKYEEYRYLLAIAILSTLYTGWQCLTQLPQLSTGKVSKYRSKSLLVDFFGDQVVSYLLISSASSAVPLTNSMRKGSDNLFTDSSATAIAMSFLAFFTLALSALISGYKLSTQSQL